MKILLLNPPGQRHYLRDYYCTTISKSDYYYHPVDLLYLSGTLSVDHNVNVLEALGRGLTIEQTISEIKSFAPDMIISLVAAPSFDEDHDFLTTTHQLCPEIRIVGTGDVFRDLGAKVFELLPFIEASLVDFSTNDITRYLDGPNGEPITNMIYRHNGKIVVGQERHDNGQFSITKPKIELFNKDLYTFPFVKQEPFMTVLSDFGCAYSCTFCPISTLGFKVRLIDEVISELQQLWDAGYREVHFRDQTFAVNKQRTIDLCTAIKENFPALTWSCFSRVDVLDQERVQAMVSAGCHTVIVGIEFDDDALQKVLKKNINTGQMFDAVKMCHQNGMRIAGTFILGLPEQDEEAILKTGELARALDLDFASFNLATPRLGTTWRRQLLDDDEIDEECWKMDTVEGTTAWKHANLSYERLNALRLKVERDFYLRPSYIIKRLGALRSSAECRTLLRNGLAILNKS